MWFSALLTKANILFSLEVAAVLLVVYAITSAIYNRFFHPYRHFPGPFWASVTPIWYWRAVRYARVEDHSHPLHKKYGPFVRIAPNQISISDPEAIETIYGSKKPFPKSAFYDGFNPHISPRKGNFEETDERKHGVRRRIVAPLYTQGAILEFEPRVDRLISLFYSRMEQFVDDRREFDMAVWLRKYTFDVIGEIFYGKECGLGMLKDNIDYNNWCHLMDVMPNAAAANSYFPYGFQTLAFIGEAVFPQSRKGIRGFFDVIRQSKNVVKERLSLMEDPEYAKGPQKNDMITRLFELVDDSPDEKKRFTYEDVTAEIWTMIWAGADTTAIALTSIFWHLHKHPETLARLGEEIEDAFATGKVQYPLRYNDCIKLPYLHAVVWEGMRIHSSLGTGLPRVVPEGGAEICGRYFAGGYGVIMNYNAVNFDKATFGEDCEVFRPERWLQKEDRDRMERAMLNFGYGTRVCIGKHITNTEMYKLLPTILRDFDFEVLVKDWTVWAGWFNQQRDVTVKVTRRRAKEEGCVVPLQVDLKD